MRPLGRAIFYNSHRALKVLLKAGADTTFMDDKGNTVLHLIARHGSEDTIKIFEAAEGVEYLGDYPNEDDLTAMDYAQKRENEEFQSAFSNFLSKVIGTASTQGQSVEEREN
jgi:ankyrin repeat protein